MIDEQGTLYIGTEWYDVDATKLTSVKDIAELLTALEMRVSPTCENFDKVKKFLIIPEKPKTLEQIEEELDEKFEKLIEQYKRNSYASKLTAERNYEREFYKIFDNFEYAVKNGQFSPTLWVTGTGLGALDGSYLVSNGGGGAEWVSNYVIKQGSNHKGYYTIGNQRYFKYYMTDKPTGIVRFFMDKLLGFKWVDDEL